MNLVRARFRRWWQSRLPFTDTMALNQRNVYILPTRAGLAFAATLTVMLLAAINYQLNLGFALTFLLAGAGVVSMHMTHGTLRGLTLHLRPPTPVFAGEPAPLDVVLTNPGGTRHGLGLRLLDAAVRSTDPHDKGTVWCDVPAQGQATAQLRMLTPHRGWHAVPTLVIETVFPFGLFRAWSVWRPASRVLAWPRPETPAPPLPASHGSDGDERAVHSGEGSELDGVRPWRRGDTMRQVVWKKVARSGELVSRETSGAAQRTLWLAWDQTQASAPMNTEARLSRLAAWVLAADREGMACGLALPGHTLQPGQGDSHRRHALDLLGGIEPPGSLRSPPGGKHAARPEPATLRHAGACSVPAQPPRGLLRRPGRAGSVQGLE